MNKKNWFLLGLLGIILILSLVFACGGIEEEEKTETTVAAAPYIKAHPTGRIYAQSSSNTADSLSVDAEGKKLTYQWYSKTDAEDIKLDGETERTFTPSIATVSDTYYYVVVTNTDITKDKKSTTLASSPARIIVTATGAWGSTTHATITVDTATKYQYIRGFGGMASVWDKPVLSKKDIDQLFSPKGFGYNILRVMIYPDMDALFNGEEGAPKGNPGAHKNYYTMVKQAKAHGALILASPWTPPAELKENESREGALRNPATGNFDGEYKIWINGDYLTKPASIRKANWGDYAQHLRDYIERMEANDAAIDYISIQNEPDIAVDYDGCYWSPEDMRDFIKEYARQIAPAGGPVKIMPGESFNFGQPLPSQLAYAAPAGNRKYYTQSGALATDPAAMAAIDLIGGHIYGNGAFRHDWAIDAGKEVWMTEYLTNTASDASEDAQWLKVWDIAENVHKCMAADFSAFVWWLSKRYYSLIGDGLAGTGTIDGQPLFRGYALSHYAKYATGKTRVKADFKLANGTASSNVSVTAYESDDEITLVFFNKGTNNIGQLNIDLPVAVNGGVSMAITRADTGTDVTSEHQMAPAFLPSEDQMLSPGYILLSHDKQTGILTNFPASCIISVRFTKNKDEAY